MKDMINKLYETFNEKAYSGDAQGEFNALLDGYKDVFGDKFELFLHCMYSHNSADMHDSLYEHLFKGATIKQDVSLAMKSFGITLTDEAGRTTSFSAGFDSEGVYFESEQVIEGDEEGSHTVSASIGDIDIDGDGWRDLDSGDYLKDFIIEVLLGEQDASEFLQKIAKDLDVNGDAGKVINNV
jgi:hypothetical protein